MRRAVLAVILLVVGADPLRGQERDAPPPDTTELAEIKRQIEALTRQIEALQLGRDVVVSADTGQFGFGPAASKVYRVRRGVSIGGYGELLYENFRSTSQDGAPSGFTDQLDALRAIVYVGYKFGDKFVFNSEIEFEHGSTEHGGSVSVEFAYIDYLPTPYLGVRAGMLLVPMGFLNELHEPPVFLGSTRPEVESAIIPSTWRENGFGVFGNAAGLAYRVYLINGLDAVGGGSSNAEGFGASGLRGGRQNGSAAVAEDLAIVGRVDYRGALGLTVGSSAFVGNSGQNAVLPSDPGEVLDARTVIWEGHLEYKAYGVDLRGLFALAWVDEAALVNAARGITGGESVGEELLGWYVQLGYDVLRAARVRDQLIPYVRWEELDTQSKVPAGFTADPARDRRIVSMGLAYKPIPNLVVKADYQIDENEARTGVNRFNIVLGYLF